VETRLQAEEGWRKRVEAEKEETGSRVKSGIDRQGRRPTIHRKGEEKEKAQGKE
jgi:hypothetical protein